MPPYRTTPEGGGYSLDYYDPTLDPNYVPPPPAAGPDMSQDPQAYQAQPDYLAPATPQAAATNPDASYAYGTSQPYYDAGPAPEYAPPVAPAPEAATSPPPVSTSQPYGYGIDDVAWNYGQGAYGTSGVGRGQYASDVSRPKPPVIGATPIPSDQRNLHGLESIQTPPTLNQRPNTGNGGGLGNIVRPSPEESLASREAYSTRRTAGVREGAPHEISDPGTLFMNFDRGTREFVQNNPEVASALSDAVIGMAGPGPLSTGMVRPSGLGMALGEDAIRGGLDSLLPHDPIGANGKINGKVPVAPEPEAAGVIPEPSTTGSVRPRDSRIRVEPPSRTYGPTANELVSPVDYGPYRTEGPLLSELRPPEPSISKPSRMVEGTSYAVPGTTRAGRAIEGTSPAPRSTNAAPPAAKTTAPVASSPEVVQVKTPEGSIGYRAVENAGSGEATGPTFKTYKEAAAYLNSVKKGAPRLRPLPEEVPPPPGPNDPILIDAPKDAVIVDRAAPKLQSDGVSVFGKRFDNKVNNAKTTVRNTRQQLGVTGERIGNLKGAAPVAAALGVGVGALEAASLAKKAIDDRNASHAGNVQTVPPYARRPKDGPALIPAPLPELAAADIKGQEGVDPFYLSNQSVPGRGQPGLDPFYLSNQGPDTPPPLTQFGPTGQFTLRRQQYQPEEDVLTKAANSAVGQAVADKIPGGTPTLDGVQAAADVVGPLAGAAKDFLATQIASRGTPSAPSFLPGTGSNQSSPAKAQPAVKRTPITSDTTQWHGATPTDLDKNYQYNLSKGAINKDGSFTDAFKQANTQYIDSNGRWTQAAADNGKIDTEDVGKPANLMHLKDVKNNTPLDTVREATDEDVAGSGTVTNSSNDTSSGGYSGSYDNNDSGYTKKSYGTSGGYSHSSGGGRSYSSGRSYGSGSRSYSSRSGGGFDFGSVSSGSSSFDWHDYLSDLDGDGNYSPAEIKAAKKKAKMARMKGMGKGKTRGVKSGKMPSTQAANPQIRADILAALEASTGKEMPSKKFRP